MILIFLVMLVCLSALSNTLISPYDDEGMLVACEEYAEFLDIIDLSTVNFNHDPEDGAKKLENIFLFAAENISNRVNVLATLISLNKNEVVYKIYESDNQWSAWGGSEFTVHLRENSYSVELDSCWDSGE